MLARGWLAYPVTPTHHPSTAEERLYKRHPIGLHSLVAERRHSSVTRYAKRSVACRDSPRHQTLRAGGTPLPRHQRLPTSSDCASSLKKSPHPARCITKKTAEERFNMLARGWLAYPVTSMHSQLPPKSGCICQHIPRFALSRRRATALFRNPVCKAQRSVPGFSSTPNSACRRYATSPPSAVASPHRPPSPIGLPHPARCITKKTAEERFHMLARGWLAYPVASMHAQLPPKSGCRNVIPRFANLMTPTQTQSPCKQLLQPLFGGRFPPSTTNPR